MSSSVLHTRGFWPVSKSNPYLLWAKAAYISNGFSTFVISLTVFKDLILGDSLGGHSIGVAAEKLIKRSCLADYTMRKDEDIANADWLIDFHVEWSRKR